MPSKEILVVEDEPLIADDIASTLVARGYSIRGPVDNADEALSLLSKSPVQLILLDVMLKGNKDGISLAREIRTQYKLPHIFLTSYYDRATLERAKVTEPEAYIVKPFDENDLVINIEMALYRSRQQPAFYSDKLFVKRKNELVSVSAGDILFAEAFDNYTKVFTATEQFIISHTLKSVEEKLAPLGFVRVHRSYLVNFRLITSITESFVCLDMNRIPLGQSYREELLSNISLL